jgi:cation diffusion facilitator CzcD-associated flavoprotein CzcO
MTHIPLVPPSEALPVVIVGAGPAGLAAARALAVRGIPYVQYERHDDVGGIWDIENPGTPMYRSAHFISSRDKSGFFDEPMPKHYADYPTRVQILDYTRAFAEAYGLRERIRFGVRVESAVQGDDGVWVVTTEASTIRASAVIACTGTTWHARRPQVVGSEGFTGEIIHSNEYRDPSRFQGRRVVVVGLGNSGADIACDAAQNADAAFISSRRGYHFIPKHILGAPSDDTEWLPIWGERLLYAVMRPILIGDVRRWGLQKPDHKLFETHPLLNTQLLHHLQHGDIAAKPGIERFDGDDVVFTDGTRERVDLVVFATGYDFAIPYLPDGYLGFTAGRPNLYLNAVARERPGLFGVSYIEVNSSAYTLFDRVADVVANHLDDVRVDRERAERFRAIAEVERPDLTGGVHFVASDRHANYVEVRAYRKALRALTRRMRWRALQHGAFERIRAMRPATDAA